mmetsp:Transcript_24566/g.34323  ORF Transcript_24566/g.34323 Transcript_24566/m.34323 type:complete len:89 (-) Transcript_24566:541-807(-)
MLRTQADITLMCMSHSNPWSTWQRQRLSLTKQFELCSMIWLLCVDVRVKKEECGASVNLTLAKHRYSLRFLSFHYLEPPVYNLFDNKI